MCRDIKSEGSAWDSTETLTLDVGDDEEEEEGRSRRTRSECKPLTSPLRRQRSGSRIVNLVQQLRRAGSSRSSVTSSSCGREAEDDVDPYELAPWQRERAQRHWKKARLLVQHSTLARRWRRDNRPMRRLWHSFKQSHTFMAGVFYRGTAGTLLPRLTRAQTVQVLLNSLALELVALCMLLSEPSGGPLVINPVKIAASGSLAALICIPGTILSAALFAPLQLIRALKRLFCCVLRSPYRLARCFILCGARCCIRGCCAACCCRGPCAREKTARVAPTTSREGFSDSINGRSSLGEVVLTRSYSKGGPRRYSYASIDYMQHSSLRRSIIRREWRAILQLAFGWGANWLLMIGLMAIVSAYGCEFYSSLAEGSRSEGFLFAWGWSVLQRFLINEPALILMSKGVPMLFASAWCETFVSEGCVACISLIVEGINNFLRSLRG